MKQDLREYFFQHRHQMSVVFSAFLLGLILGGSLYWHAKRQIVVKQEAFERVSVEKRELLRKFAATEVEARVLRSSQANLKKTIEEREATIAEQETSLEFYRQLMVVDNKKEGLDLNSYTITRGDITGALHFRFTFVQYAKQHQNLSGRVNVRLEGKEKGKVAIYYLRDLLTTTNANFGQLQFKYYQILEGDFTLPKGFEPQQIVVDADLTIKSEPWQRKLAWQIEEL
jgi:hypothetical protein